MRKNSTAGYRRARMIYGLHWLSINGKRGIGNLRRNFREIPGLAATAGRKGGLTSRR